jgi:tetratricopeptide (TPR) repeat protein
MKKFIIDRKFVFSLLLLISVLPACNNYLTIAPENDLIKEKFWAKREDVDGALAATYDAFRNAVQESFIWGEVRAEIAVFGDQFGDYRRIAGSDITPSNGKINWEKYYQAINLANTLMHFDNDVLAKDLSFTQKMKDQVDAEALFIRSLSYYYLIRVWKEVPLVLTPSISDKDNLFPFKSSEKVVIKQIINDLLIAKENAMTDEFKDNPTYYKGRANKYSIMALLADVYLWDEQYQKSVDYCDSIINTGKFGLEPYSTWFNMYNPGNSMIESIFEIQFDDNLESQENPMYDAIFNKSQLSFNLTSLDKFLVKDDIRLCGKNKPIWKYKGVDLMSTVGRSGTQRDGNMIYYRYADILLLKAEALVELGRNDEANSLIRQTRERAGLTHVDVIGKTDLRKAVLDEKAAEFVIEGKRWFDLLRAAKRNKFENKQIIIDMILSGADVKKQAILKTRVFDTMSYYLPIPEHEILYNQNLVQNPFYNR